jgi:predicted nucleic acid-binding protein
VIHSTNASLPFTGLHRLEMKNALSLGVFRRALTRAQANATWQDIQNDLRSGRLFPRSINWVPVFRSAAQIAAKHSDTIGTRSLDVLHIAVAKHLNATEFFSFDQRQRDLATAVGLKVKP